jgi:hypothetical protein
MVMALIRYLENYLRDFAVTLGCGMTGPKSWCPRPLHWRQPRRRDDPGELGWFFFLGADIAGPLDSEHSGGLGLVGCRASRICPEGRSKD